MSILIVFSVILALGIAFCFYPKRYTAQGTLWVQPGASSAEQLSSALSSIFSGQTNDIIASEVDALQSYTLFLRVAKELNLVNNKDFWGPMPFSMPSADVRTLDNAETRGKVYTKLTKIITVENDGKDEIIDIDAKTYSPELSAKIVNTLINDYMQYLFEMRYGSTKRTSGWLVDQLGSLKQKVDQDQVELTNLQGQLGVIGFNQANAVYLYGQSLGDLMKAADEATIERIVAEAKLHYLQNSNPNLIEGEINILPGASLSGGSTQSLLATLRASQAEISANYARLLSQYGPNYPDVKQQKAQLTEVNAQLKAEQQRILNQAQLSYNAASANEKMTTDKVEKQKTQVFDSHNAMVRFVLLMQDYQSDRDLYEGLIQHVQGAVITSGLEAGDIDIVDLADLPQPDKPGPVLIIIGAVVGGLILGVFFALWMAAMDRRISGPEQVESMTGLAVLAQVPHVKFEKSAGEKQEAPQIIVSARRSHYAEAIQALRASLLLAKPGAAPKVILITSATPNEGKSTIAVNLAATFAHHGARVLIIDCDLRRGTIAVRLRVSAAKGLTSVLTRQMKLEASVQELPGVPGLFVMPDGPQPPDPAILIGSDEMGRVIDACRGQYDFVILDSPPILGIADGLHLGQLADSVVLVIRENVSNRKAVQESVAKMEASHLPISGFVFNDVDPRASSYGYGYSYRDYYRGYYTDSNEVPSREV
jgi:capsular exopolysaccharide synthesis family protein